MYVNTNVLYYITVLISETMYPSAINEIKLMFDNKLIGYKVSPTPSKSTLFRTRFSGRTRIFRFQLFSWKMPSHLGRHIRLPLLLHTFYNCQFTFRPIFECTFFISSGFSDKKYVSCVESAMQRKITQVRLVRRMDYKWDDFPIPKNWVSIGRVIAWWENYGSRVLEIEKSITAFSKRGTCTFGGRHGRLGDKITNRLTIG